MKTIRYSLTFLGELEIPDNLSDPDIKDEIARDWYERGFDIQNVNDIEWEEV